jgi:hypothetical protein
MTSWSAPGSPIRYYQCPFCQRTHSSLYGEVFRRRAGARVLDARGPAAAAPGIPMPSQDDVRWARVKATAARWFARLEADVRRCAESEGRPAEDATGLASRRAEAPDADPADVVEVAPVAAGRRS